MWDILRCALPDNNKGSKVITTTRIETVAKACCSYRPEFIYKMKPLNDENSAKLFFSRVGYVCAQSLKDISDEILQKCGGLPLAIISISSLLASQPARSREQWKFVCSSLRSNLRENPTLEGMRQVLKLSYSNLPLHLKTCLLYIGMYPEDHCIEKVDLVRLWVAEGFVANLCDEDAEEVAGSYFNELVNRSMIQPTNTGYNGEVSRCKVHDMILDLIRLKSEEENFLRVVDNANHMALSSQSKVRRLSLHLGFGEDQDTAAATSLSMSHMRSFALFGNTGFTPPISRFKYIRVLNLKDWRTDGHDIVDLTPVCKLFQLRYLNIGRKARLPAQISNLQCLETLELNKLDGDVPSDIVHLPYLLHFVVPSGKRLPDGICAMRSLRTLRCFDVGLNSVDNFKGVAELLNVRDLVISCSGTAPQQGIMDTLWCSIAKLISCKLRALTFPFFPANLPPPIVGLDHLAISQAEHHLEVLEVSSTLFPQVPSWIGQHCSRLSILSLTVNILRQNDVDLLVQLPNLLDLKLNIRKCPTERILIDNDSSAVAFPALKLFTFSCFAPCLFFGAGALPNLHTLTLNHHGRGLENVKLLEGVQHLLNLKEVHVVFTNGYCGGRAMPGIMEAAAEATYRDAISMHPGKSGIKILVNLFCLVMPPSAFYYDSDDGVFVGN